MRFLLSVLLSSVLVADPALAHGFMDRQPARRSISKVVFNEEAFSNTLLQFSQPPYSRKMSAWLNALARNRLLKGSFVSVVGIESLNFLSAKTRAFLPPGFTDATHVFAVVFLGAFDISLILSFLTRRGDYGFINKKGLRETPQQFLLETVVLASLSILIVGGFVYSAPMLGIWSVIFVGLYFAGATANRVEMETGGVYDYLVFKWGGYNWYRYNLSDVMVYAGASGFVGILYIWSAKLLVHDYVFLGLMLFAALSMAIGPVFRMIHELHIRANSEYASNSIWAVIKARIDRYMKTHPGVLPVSAKFAFTLVCLSRRGEKMRLTPNALAEGFHQTTKSMRDSLIKLRSSEYGYLKSIQIAGPGKSALDDIVLVNEDIWLALIPRDLQEFLFDKVKENAAPGSPESPPEEELVRRVIQLRDLFDLDVPRVNGHRGEKTAAGSDEAAGSGAKTPVAAPGPVAPTLAHWRKTMGALKTDISKNHSIVSKNIKDWSFDLAKVLQPLMTDNVWSAWHDELKKAYRRAMDPQLADPLKYLKALEKLLEPIPTKKKALKTNA